MVYAGIAHNITNLHNVLTDSTCLRPMMFQNENMFANVTFMMHCSV